MNIKGLIFELIVLTFLFTFSSCKKENELPSCTITYPTSGDEFEQGDTIAISVRANDKDGSIVEINYNIDDVKVFSSSSFPYSYSWNTLDETIGNHIIKVIAKDNDGGSQTDECTISIIGNATVTTTEADSITHVSARSGGNITDNGGTSILERGVCWNNSNNPTLSNEHTMDGSSSGSFTSSILGLSPNVTYYVRAYATNSVGVSYGNEISFTTSSNETGTVTDYDGNTYNTVKIGNQWWMAENLKVTYYPNGTEIQLVESNSAWDTLDYTDIAYCYYDNSSANGDTYGALYTWEAVMNSSVSSSSNPSGVQGVCPDDWHVPSDAEWAELVDYLGGESVAGGKLKEKGNTHWISHNGEATNESGFTALPGGYRYGTGNFVNIGKYGFWWSSTESSSATAWGRLLGYYYRIIYRYWDFNEGGFSVRCVKDE